MNIEIKLFASLRKYRCQDKDRETLEVPQGFTVGQLLALRGIPPAEAHVVLVNGIRAEHSHVLADGDSVSAFPLIGGG